jgi:hypothetical protein
MFQPKESWVTQCRQWLKTHGIEGHYSCLHVRRTDMLADPEFDLPEPAWYETVMKCLPPPIIVVSDGPLWGCAEPNVCDGGCCVEQHNDVRFYLTGQVHQPRICSWHICLVGGLHQPTH